MANNTSLYISVWSTMWSCHNKFYICLKMLFRNPLSELLYYRDVIMSAMVSQITGVTTVCSAICSCADQRKHQSHASLAFAWRIHRWPVNSTHFIQFTDCYKHKTLSFSNGCKRNTIWGTCFDFQNLIFLSYYTLQWSSRLCKWLYLRYLVPWINHLTLVCWSDF